MIRDQRLDFLFLQETKMQKENLEQITLSKSMRGVAASLEGASRGLLILYKTKAYEVKPICKKENVLLCVVENQVTNDTWFVLNIYAPNSRREWIVYWRRVLQIVQGCNVNKGIIMGDFNTPLTNHEKFGGLASDLESKQDLASFINLLSFLNMELPLELLLGPTRGWVMIASKLGQTER